MLATERRIRRGGPALAVCIAMLLAGCGSSSKSSSSTPSSSTAAPATTTAQGSLGPEKVPLELGPPLAPASTTLPGTAIDGVKCAPVEQLAYHVHAHLQVFVSGTPRSLPGGIGLVNAVAQQTPYGPFFGAQGCYYWLHTHTNDGVIHIESPTSRIYTLGDFFDEWHEPLGPSQVAGDSGSVTAFVNGRRWTGSPRAIPLTPHAVVQLDVGSPVVDFQPLSWAGVGL